MTKNKVLIIFHKPLSQLDGQTKYVLNLIDSVKSHCELEIPSEEFYRTTHMEKRNWLLRTSLVNFYLIYWLIVNNKNIKNNFSICIIEDRYCLFPARLLSLHKNLRIITRISDWGKDYTDTLAKKSITQSFAINFLNIFYEHYVVNYSFASIVPSLAVKSKMRKNYNKHILLFTHFLNIDAEKKEIKSGDFRFRDKDHDIYVVLIGNYDYKPNEDSANFVVQTLAPMMKLVDTKIKFLIVGNGSEERYGRFNSDNLLSLGQIENLDSVYTLCQIGINPSLTPGGTSIKNIEYLLHGLRVISTEESATGVMENALMKVGEREEFPELIAKTSEELRNVNFEKNLEVLEELQGYYSITENKKKIAEFLDSL